MKNNGATVWARQTIESEIFYYKPDKWFKIWFYIVNRVNHTDNKLFKRGQNLMTYKEIQDATKSTKNQVDSFMRWAREQSMLTTQKTTRGMVVTVLKYAKYQNFSTYRTDTKTETKPKQNRHRTDTITNNDNNETMIYNTTYTEVDKKILKFLKTLPEIKAPEKYLDWMKKKYGVLPKRLLETEFSKWSTILGGKQ